MKNLTTSNLASDSEVQIKLEELLDSQDIMQILHISQRTLQTYRSNGTIP